MTRVSVRRYLIRWVPPVVAAHTRVKIGPNEHYFVNDNEPPAIVPASRSHKLVAEVRMGLVDGEEAMATVERVNRLFVPGTYHVLWRNCVVYSYVLCCALFGPDETARAFPTDANQLVCLAQGWGDYLRGVVTTPDRWRETWPDVAERARRAWLAASAAEALAEAAVPHVPD